MRLKNFLLLVFAAILFHPPAQAKVKRNKNKPPTPIEYKGTVTDSRNKPLAGVILQVGNSDVKITSNGTGGFSVTANPGDTLVASSPTFKTFQYILTNNPTISIRLAGDNDILNIASQPPVELIYTTSPANLTTASTDQVYNAEIQKTPVASYRNALGGRLAGLFTLQSSGLPGADGASLSLRGQAPAAYIDGVYVGDNLQSFDLEEIESVTVLKDAVATAMLGVRGSRGAILITTKKGRDTRQQVSFTAQTAVQQPLAFPKTLNAYDYARLHNEALRNDGVDSAYSGAYYSQTALDAYRNHSDPYKYPDVNYRDEITKKSSAFNRYTLSTTGGNRYAKYFVSLEHVNQSGFFKTVDSNSYNTNNSFKSYIIRSNVDVNITKKLSGGIYLLGRILNGNEPGATAGSIISGLLNTPANAYPLLNPDNTFAGNQIYQNNLLAQTIGSGYRTNYRRDILVNVYLKQMLDDITPGLWMKAKVAYYATLSETVFRDKSYAVFQQNATGYSQYGSNGTQANGNGIDFQGRTDYEELSLGYNRTFNGVHGIDATLLLNRDNSSDGFNLPYTITGTSGRIAYNYKAKYIAEVAYAVNGSNRYPGGKTKVGFFPSIGLGWNIEQEDFLKTHHWISRLKLYGSYGKTGWDNAGNFVYYPRFFDGPLAYFGTGASSSISTTEGPFPYPGITWEKANKLNLGLTGAVLNNQLSVTIEYFRNKYSDLLQQRGSNSTTIGNDYPDQNIGKNRYKGWELQLGWQQTVKDFQYFISANGSTVGSEVLYINEVSRPYSYNNRTGQPVGQRFGYIADGLFQTQAEINSGATTTGYKAQPGDIKYRDLNSDGVINYLDQAAIGRTKPLFFYGLTVGFSFKGFDVSALLQGVKNRDIYLSGNSYWSFQSFGTGQGYANALNRWTPQNTTTATYPRLSFGNNSNNYTTSSYWVKSGDYLRLKNAEIGYSLPASIISKIKLNTVRIFANGYNLLTHASSTLDGRDPEAFSGGYPVQRLYNFGINIKF